MRWLALLGFVGGTFVAAGVGGWLSSKGLGPWYDSLKKPSWNPPSWVFGPVWTALYAAMGVAAWLVWNAGGFGWPLGVYALQLALNVLWSALFFALRSPGAAAAEIVALWAAIAGTVAAFAPVSRPAAALLLPYLGWVTFAAGLNGTVWRLNRPAPSVSPARPAQPAERPSLT